MALLVGTSGWQYKDWREPFYEGRPQRLWLAAYAEHFPTVEVNNAFYRLPERSTFEKWCAQVPDGFVAAVKASRYLTHVKRLKEPAEPVARLADAFGAGDAYVYFNNDQRAAAPRDAAHLVRMAVARGADVATARAPS